MNGKIMNGKIMNGKIIMNGSGQGLRRFYLNENFQRVWIDIPSGEWLKQQLKPRYPNKEEVKK